MAYIKETNTNMNVEKKGGRKSPRFYRADLAGPVKITKADRYRRNPASNDQRRACGILGYL